MTGYAPSKTTPHHLRTTDKAPSRSAPSWRSVVAAGDRHVAQLLQLAERQRARLGMQPPARLSPLAIRRRASDDLDVRALEHPAERQHGPLEVVRRRHQDGAVQVAR